MPKYTVSFILNGRRVEIEPNEGMTVLSYLRNVEHLMGSKLGCGTGHCGACTILLDGQPTRACLLKLSRIDGKCVTTIEGLQSEDGSLHPIQTAFLEMGAVQCGFCTPAMVLTAKALLDANPTPTRSEICKAFSHNYCRCTGYTKIIKAVEFARDLLFAKVQDDQPLLEETRYVVQGGGEQQHFKVLGKRCLDWDGRQKVSGGLLFADDMTREGMLIGRPVFSEHAHAVIVDIKVEDALAVPGVVAVLTSSDVPSVNGFGMVVADQPVLCKDEVNFVGDVVALVVADTEKAAQEGARRVKVQYETLPGTFDIDTPKAQGNVIREIYHTQGDFESVRDEKDLLVLKGHFETTWVEHAYLEPESVISYPENGKLVVMTPTQAPFELRRQIANVLALPLQAVRVIVTPLGGGFGGKGDATVQPLCALAAHILACPVKITLTRKESLSMSTKKHPYHMDYEIGLDREGSLRYVDADLVSDGGPYANLSPRVIDQSCIFAVGPYRVGAGRVRGRCIRTNNVLSSAMRGFGINQVSFAMEVLLDQAAEKLGLDPFVLREKNAFVPGDQTFSGEVLSESVGMVDTIQACREDVQKVLALYRGMYPNGSKALGVGMASCFKNVGAGKGRVDNAGATVSRSSGGRFSLAVSGVDMGQGFRTAMAQLASETLGVPIDMIDVLNGDTDVTSIHGSAVGERQTLVSGMAVMKACQLFLDTSKGMPDGEPFSVHYDHEAVRTFSLGDEEGRRSVPPGQYKNYPTYTYATQAVILEVDKASGKVQVLDVIVSNDAGRVLNPTILEGQIEGCCSMGIGYALSEQFKMQDGIPLSTTFGALGVPRMDTTPAYHISFIEDPEPFGPYGAKGISEVGTVPMTAAILNALHDALGVRINTIPATPEVILAALQAGPKA